MSKKGSIKETKAPTKNELVLEPGDGDIINGILKKILAARSALSENGQLALLHLIIDNNKDLNDKRNALLAK